MHLRKRRIGRRRIKRRRISGQICGAACRDKRMYEFERRSGTEA
jgi:hypothetical protein